MPAGFGSVAIGGPWSGKPTILEFYVIREHRERAFELFETFHEACGAELMEVQSNDVVATVMLHTYARDIKSESILFHDGFTTTLASKEARLEQLTSDDEIRRALVERQGGGEWRLQMGAETVATGGILFHYNAPYGDVYMDVAAPFRRRGFGATLVQELKRIAYELGAIPGARCNPQNVPSRRTLQKAGFVPFAHILTGSIAGT
jgi:GNAT superfamily N-acetyltransferase